MRFEIQAVRSLVYLSLFVLARPAAAQSQLVAWGGNEAGQCDVPALPAGLSYVQVGAGDYHSLACRSDGSAVGWGSNYLGECDVPALPPGIHYIEVDGSYVNSVGLRSDGTVVAWGWNNAGQNDVPALPPGLTYVEVTAGLEVNLARRSDGSVIAWGATINIGPDAPALPPGLTYVQIGAGWEHAVALRSDGSIIAWGSNSSGQCAVPALPPGLSYVSLSAGARHTLALRSDGSVVAWGECHQGSCDVPALPPGLSYVEVAAGQLHSLARRSDGSVVAWGDNYYGECDVPALPPGFAYVEIEAGKYQSLARMEPIPAITRASLDSLGSEGDDTSMQPSISADGRYVAFASWASDLVPGDTNGTVDVFVRDRHDGQTTRVSVDSGGGQANGFSSAPSISADGRFVAFQSMASNLVFGDTNVDWDVFVHDRQTGATTRVSLNLTGGQSDFGSFRPSISADGRFVAYDSVAVNTAVDTNGSSDVFVHDRQSGLSNYVSLDPLGAVGNGDSVTPRISANGLFVAFESDASNLVSGDTNVVRDIFVRNLQTGSTTRASVSTAGVQANSFNYAATISADGRWVAFQSNASNLVTGDTNAHFDILVHDRQTSETTRVSVDSAGNQASLDSVTPSISADGRFVAFASNSADLVAGDNNLFFDVFVHDRQAGTTERDSVDSLGAQGNGFSQNPALAGDGRYVAFESSASNLVHDDTNGTQDVFEHDRGVLASAFAPYCFGDGSGTACPCANSGAAGHGCQNSTGSGGALLVAAGAPSLAADTLGFTASGLPQPTLGIVIQGTSSHAPASFGDGLRCAGGTLQVLYVKSSIGGVVIAPLAADPRVSARSASLGDPLAAGTTRYYEVDYLDLSFSFCRAPQGGLANASNGVAVTWMQ